MFQLQIPDVSTDGNGIAILSGVIIALVLIIFYLLKMYLNEKNQPGCPDPAPKQNGASQIPPIQMFMNLGEIISEQRVQNKTLSDIDRSLESAAENLGRAAIKIEDLLNQAESHDEKFTLIINTLQKSIETSNKKISDTLDRNHDLLLELKGKV